MKMNWAMKGIVLGAILLQGLAVAPPSPMIPLGESVTILEGSSIHVAGAGVRIDVHAVGVLWYVDGQQAVFAELTVTCRGEKIEQTVKLGGQSLFRIYR